MMPKSGNTNIMMNNTLDMDILANLGLQAPAPALPANNAFDNAFNFNFAIGNGGNGTELFSNNGGNQQQFMEGQQLPSSNISGEDESGNSMEPWMDLTADLQEFLDSQSVEEMKELVPTEPASPPAATHAPLLTTTSCTTTTTAIAVENNNHSKMELDDNSGADINQLIQDVESYLMDASGGVPTTVPAKNNISVTSAAHELFEAIQEANTFEDENKTHLTIKREECSSATSVIVSMDKVQRQQQQKAAPAPLHSGYVNVVDLAQQQQPLAVAAPAPAMDNSKKMKEEVEEFVRAFSSPAATQQQQQQMVSNNVSGNNNSINNVVNNPSDAILRALVTGSVVQDCGLDINEDDLRHAVTTTAVGENGEKVVIIITKPQQSSSSSVVAAAVNSAEVDAGQEEEILGVGEEMSSTRMVDVMVDDGISDDNVAINNNVVNNNNVANFELFVPVGSPAVSYISEPESSIAAPSPESNIAAPSPLAPSEASNNYSDGDSEWAPSPRPAQERKKYQRKNPRVPKYLCEPYPCDKTERKKAQNKTAAYRYRQKKLAEQEAADKELKDLMDYNISLKAKLANIQNEMKCMKKLLQQTGLDNLAKAINV